MASAYIPAWQKLGLKLKNQTTNGDQASTSTNTSSIGATPRKRKFGAETSGAQDSPSATKKSKKASNSPSTASSNGTTESRPTRDQQLSPESRRKSVTFSADTKVEDGNSSKRLVQAAHDSRWARLTGLEGDDLAAATEVLDNMEQMADDDDRRKSSRSVMKETTTHEKEAEGDSESKSKQHKKPAAQPSSKVELARQRKKSELAMKYLEEYKNSRATWKFNKSRQVAVLKMAFEVDKIPVEYNEALNLYLEGLQGETSRQNLRIEAEQRLSKAEEQDSRATDAAGERNIFRAKLILEALQPVVDKEAVAEHFDDGKANHNGEEATIRQPIKTSNTTSNGAAIAMTNGRSTTPSTTAAANGINKADQTANGEASTSPNKRRRRRLKKRRNRSESDSDSDSSSSDSSSSSSSSSSNSNESDEE